METKSRRVEGEIVLVVVLVEYKNFSRTHTCT